MATLQSYASGSVSAVVDEGAGEIVITGGVLTVNGLLDELPDTVHTIRCRGSGGLRFIAGANGKLGGKEHTINVVEEDDAFSFGDDNGKSTKTGGGVNSRFGPGTTNTIEIENVRWYMEGRSNRSDFDVGQGTNSNGTGGCACTFRGLHLIQQYTSGDTGQNNHMYSRNLKLEIHPDLGYGFKISNYTNTHAIIIEVPPNDQFQGLEISNVSVPNTGGRVVVAHQANDTFTLFDLNTPDITESTNHSTAKTILVNPVGVPTRTNNWDGYNSIMEIQRDIPFTTNATSGKIVALHQNTNAQAADAEANIGSDGTASVRVKTNYSAYQASNGAWDSLDGFQFYAVGLGFDKYYSGTTTINVGNDPATRNLTLGRTELPDGTAITSKTSGAIETAADLVNALKTYEVANPTYPNLSTRLLVVANGVVTITTGQIVLSTTASDFITRSGNTITIQTDSGGIDASNGVTLLNAGTSYNVPSGTKGLIGFPLRDSTGTSALINIDAPQCYSGVYKNDGTQLGVRTFASRGTQSVAIPASNTGANTRVGAGRAGYTPQNRAIDTSAGGTFNVEFADMVEEFDFFGDAKLDTNADISGMGVSFTTTGEATINIPNRSVSAHSCYRALHNQFANPLGAKFVAFGRANLDFVPGSGGIPSVLSLGANVNLRRASSSGSAAGVGAYVTGGRGGSPVNEDRGGIQLGSISSSGGGGNVNLQPLTDAVAAVKAETAVLRRQNQNVLQTLPLTFFEPFSPAAAATGMPGMEHVRDVESRNWPINAHNVTVDPDHDGSGEIVFPSNGTGFLQFTLYRRDSNNDLVVFSKESIMLLQFYPTAFNSTNHQHLFVIGGCSVFVSSSTGDTSTLRVGGTNNSIEVSNTTINLNQWNTIAVTIAPNPDAVAYPWVHLAVNGGAAQSVNAGSQDVIATIGGSAFFFNVGALSDSIVGSVRALYFHPAETLDTDDRQYGWIPPTGISWNEDLVDWFGTGGISDRGEGVAIDSVEEVVEDSNSKINELPQNTAAAVASRSLAGQTATKDGLLGERIKWLTDNVNTTAPDSKADIAAEIGARTIPNSPTAGTYDAAMANAEDAYTGTPPTASDIGDDAAGKVWNASLSSYTTAGSAGLKLSETSTHDAPADSPTAADIWNHAIPNSPTAGTAIAKLDSLVNGPTAAQINTEIGNQEIANGISRIKAERIGLAVDAGTTEVAGSDITFKDPGDQSTAEKRVKVTVGAEDGVRTASEIDPD